MNHQPEKSSWSSRRPTMLKSLEQSFVQQNHTYPPAQMVSSKEIRYWKSNALKNHLQTQPLVGNTTQYELNPKGKNGYYYQVQMTMHCTGVKFYQFFAWEDKSDDYVLVSVDYDATFVQNILPRLRAFYFQHLLVRLVDEVHAKRLKLCNTIRHCVLSENINCSFKYTCLVNIYSISHKKKSIFMLIHIVSIPLPGVDPGFQVRGGHT